jgi:hypothetical protein
MRLPAKVLGQDLEPGADGAWLIARNVTPTG